MEWTNEKNETDQIISSRTLICLMREREFHVLLGSQNKHFVNDWGEDLSNILGLNILHIDGSGLDKGRN